MAGNDLDAVFAALANQNRRAIVSRLSRCPATVGELAAPLGISHAAVSQHLKVLEKAGLIERTAAAQWRNCAIRFESLDAVSDWIEEHRRQWNTRFDRLDDRIKHMKGRQDND